MGCVSSRRDINDIHSNIFQVMNVDELGQHVTPGQLELTETELVLYQRGKAATRWPLRCLRRYGFEDEIFSFESGRRCPTGSAIYAFRCRRAEQLFNLLQQNIQLRNLNEDPILGTIDPIIPPVSSGPPVSSRPPNEQSYLDSVNRPVLPRTQVNRISRPGSVTSNGPASPPSASSPTPINSESTAVSEHNNNKRSKEHSYSNTLPLLEGDSIASSTAQPYMNLEPTSSPTLSSSSEPYAQLNMDSEAECGHLYVNVTPGEPSTLASSQKNVFEAPVLVECDEREEHCYANLHPCDIETTHVNVLLPQTTNVQTSLSIETTHRMNYIELDLKSKTDPAPSAPTGTLPPESPRRPAKGYATIDFNKTVALSHSVNPGLEDNEGSRKTRHNSTIGELAPILARHSTSLSD